MNECLNSSGFHPDACYVCAAHITSLTQDGKNFCSENCLRDYQFLQKVATAIESSEATPRQSKLTPYSDMSLFEPVDLNLRNVEDFLDWQENNRTFILPVCVEAVPYYDSSVILLVKQRDGRTFFETGKEGAVEFKDMDDARRFLEEMQAQYVGTFNFKLWSKEALL